MTIVAKNAAAGDWLVWGRHSWRIETTGARQPWNSMRGVR